MSTSVIDGNIGGLFAVSLTLNPASVATITAAEQDFTVKGVRASDLAIYCGMTTATAGLGIAGYRVKAKDTVSVTFVNPTAGALDAASGNFKMIIARTESELPGSLS